MRRGSGVAYFFLVFLVVGFFLLMFLRKDGGSFFFAISDSYLRTLVPPMVVFEPAFHVLGVIRAL